jgi:hypothetical protein
MTVREDDIPAMLIGKSKDLKGGVRGSQTALMQKRMRDLPVGKCLAITKETDEPKELERKRAHWLTTARRADPAIPMVSSICKSPAGDLTLYLWRKES